MFQVSQFWRDRLAGVPLSPAWARKDAAMALQDLTLLDELPLRAWMQIDAPEQRRLLRAAVLVEA